MPDLFIGRQPIFDVDLNVYAYELLFRSSEDQAGAGVVDGNNATSQVMLNAFFDIGLNNLVGDNKAFINLTQYFLEDANRISFPPGQVVLEVLEDVVPNELVIETLTTLKSMGHTIALDDFELSEHLKPMVCLADIVKIDVMSLNREEIELHVKELRGFNLKLLAEKVETYQEFEYLKDLGFDYYQGYFFAKPTIVKGKGLKLNQTSILQLIAKVNSPTIEIEELSDIISMDVSLSHKVMKFVNSSASGIKVEVNSIQQAVSLLGLNTIKNWVSIAVLATAEDKPNELSTLAMVRAKACLELAKASGQPKSETFFTVGLFSTLDAMMDQPLSVLLADLPLADDLKKGLLEKSGVYGEVINCVIAMERNDLNNISFQKLDIESMSEIYLGTLLWADQQGAQKAS